MKLSWIELIVLDIKYNIVSYLGFTFYHLKYETFKLLYIVNKQKQNTCKMYTINYLMWRYYKSFFS